VQTGAKGATEQFNRFVDGQGGSSKGGYRNAPLDETKADFWDSFGEPAAETKPSAIGTAAMKGGHGGSSGAGGLSGQKKEGDDKWDAW
jgi:ADP-ribosylation factor GTPase-activating protein 1